MDIRFSSNIFIITTSHFYLTGKCHFYLGFNFSFLVSYMRIFDPNKMADKG